MSQWLGHLGSSQWKMLLACVLAGPPFFWIANLSCGAGQCQTRPLLKPWCPPCCWRTVPHAKLWLTFYWRGKLLSINFLISHNMVFCQNVITKYCKLWHQSNYLLDPQPVYVVQVLESRLRFAVWWSCWSPLFSRPMLFSTRPGREAPGQVKVA